MRVLELCAGSGHHGEAVRMVARGARVVCYVEREVTAAGILVARVADGSLDDAPIWTDLRTFDGGEWRGVVDLVIGGFPCQPYSVAGKQLGSEDERDLWEECLRVLLECGARLAFFENVGGGLREYHRRFRPDLEGAGYRVQEIVCSASDATAPHGRERLFFLAVADSTGIQPRKAGELGAGIHASGRGREGVANTNRRGLGTESGAPGRRHDADDRNPILGDSEGEGLEGRSGSEREELAGPGQDGGTVARPFLWPPGFCRDAAKRGFDHRPGECEECDGWRFVVIDRGRVDLSPALPQPEFRRVADGLGRGMDLARADRLRILGNGVVPQQAAIALRLLAEELGVTL